MRVMLIAAMAWTAAARAVDIPKNATHEVQRCTVSIDGGIYNSNNEFEGTIPSRGELVQDRYSWKDGEIEYTVTKGKREGDGTATYEGFVKREKQIAGDIETESLVMTNQSTQNGFTDTKSSYEINAYQIVGNSKVLQSRLVNNREKVVVNETITTTPTATGRTVTTTIQGPFTQTLSDVSGQYATIRSKVTTCTFDPPAGQS